ncbi:MAG: hypothetical protein AAFO82_02905, partial [Bacteroidota bacterium]
RKKAKKYVKECRNKAWEAYLKPIKENQAELKEIFDNILNALGDQEKIRVRPIYQAFQSLINPVFADLVEQARKMHFQTLSLNNEPLQALRSWLKKAVERANKKYHTDLYSDSPYAATKVREIEAVITKDSPTLSGYQILNAYFDKLLKRDPRVVAFGEDVGNIGDVNQGFAGLQEKHGEHRVFDTGIREWTIMGQAIGLAMRGLRPIAEIQYLDYLIYGLEPLTDDLATLRYRSGGIQQAPAIIRTRGHRLEGIWHSGSPMGMMLHSLRGMYILVPRNMVQAAGFYNTMMQSYFSSQSSRSAFLYRSCEPEVECPCGCVNSVM